MAEFRATAQLKPIITISLTEDEARALHYLFSYQHELVMEAVEEKIGSGWRGKEHIIKSLSDGIRESVSIFDRLDKARDVFEGKKVAVNKRDMETAIK